MRRAVILLVFGVLFAAPSQAAAARVPTLAISIVHVVHGCHVWMLGSRELGPTPVLRTKPGARLKLRVSCPMSFDVVQTTGPKLALGNRRFVAGTARTIVFPKPGVYRIVARNVETSEEMGLQTLGPDNVLRLTVRVA
jgi:hypothetical protein